LHFCITNSLQQTMDILNFSKIGCLHQRADDITTYYQKQWDSWWFAHVTKYIKDEYNEWIPHYGIFPTILTNPNLTMEMVEKLIKMNLGLPIDYNYLSSNPNLTIQFINAHPIENWNWHRISCNYGISFEDIMQCPKKQWQELSENPNVTIEIIKNNLDLPWNLHGLCRNPSITMELVTLLPKMKNKTGSMNWKNLEETCEQVKAIKILHPNLTIIPTYYLKYQSVFDGLHDEYRYQENIKIKNLNNVEFDFYCTYELTKSQYFHNNTMWVFLATILEFYETPTNFADGYGNFTNTDYVFSNSFLIMLVAKN
jgi:hypothetical protein